MTLLVPPPHPDDTPRFLSGGGEMGSLMRAHDWSATGLGDPALWPQTLRSMVCLLLNSHHPMYIFWGADARCFYNDAYRQSLGPERHPGSLGQPARQVWSEIWDSVGPQIAQVMAGGGPTWHEDKLFVVTRHGRRGDAYWTYGYSPINDDTAASGVGGVLVVCSETTRAVEARMLEKQRLETLARLTGGIAHDFNNLLTPIMGGIDVLAIKLSGNDKAQRIATGAMQSAERARILVQRLLAFGRMQTLKSAAVQLSALVAGMDDLIGRTLGELIALVVDIPADLPLVEIDAPQVELAILNLCINAREAMGCAGQLTITARQAGSGDNADMVSLRLTDTGKGMDRETLERAIEPFFTTKAIGEGVGLGLSMVDGLAAQMGGAFTLTSAPGGGTTAELLLPVARSLEPGAALADTVIAAGADRTNTILLADDEALVSMAIADDLVELGYIVVEAASGAEALALLGDMAPPDLLITDYRMPGMTGTALARAVRSQLPALPVLMITGFAQLSPAETEGLGVLTKPFRIADLADRIALLLGVPARRAA